jgi:hypothetical protein
MDNDRLFPHPLPGPLVDLCEQVCGGVRRQLDELDALLTPSRAQ